MNVLTTIHPATSADREAIVNLLSSVNLPTTDLPLELNNFVIIRHENAVVGSCGLELFGSVALLRSLAVAVDLQGQGLGNSLYQAALNIAKTKKVKQLFLITNTAASLFENQGFTKVYRTAVPSAIQNTAQFSSNCPSSATVMYRIIT